MTLQAIPAALATVFLESSYNNCEYENGMINEVMSGCFESINLATRLNKPVRHIFFLPFDKAKNTDYNFRMYHSLTPLDYRHLMTVSEQSYCFWMFGYWLGLNKLNKTSDLAYKDGKLIAIFVFDNKIAREKTPLGLPLKKRLATWSQNKNCYLLNQ